MKNYHKKYIKKRKQKNISVERINLFFVFHRSNMFYISAFEKKFWFIYVPCNDKLNKYVNRGNFIQN